MAGALLISSLESIPSLDVDLTGITLCIEQVTVEDNALVFKEPLILETRPSENRPYWEVHLPDIDLFAYGLTREELLKEIESSIRFLWKEIALADLDSLDDPAKIVRNRLLARIEVRVK